MPDLRTITEFKSQLAGGGARPNLFEVVLSVFPGAATANTGATWNSDSQKNFAFMCKAAALPASNISPIDVPFRGRILKVAGDRTFDTWTVTVINDENFSIRTAFEYWMNGISKLSNNTGATDPTSYMTDASVHQLGRGAGNGINSGKNYTGTGAKSLKTYKFYSIFPTNISQIDLSYDSSDTIEEFTVEFQVQYWEASAGASAGGDAGGGTDSTTTDFDIS